MFIHIGTDVYGAVRSVDRTSIVTKFGTFQFIPVIPLESYYYAKVKKESSPTRPLFGIKMNEDAVAIPCNRLNWLSVLVGYFRAAGTVMLLIGGIGVVIMGSIGLCDNRFSFDRDWQIGSTVAGGLLAVGLLVTMWTYYFTIVTLKQSGLDD